MVRRNRNGRARGRRIRRTPIVPFTLFGSIANDYQQDFKVVDLKDLGGAAIFSGRPIRIAHATFEFVAAMGSDPTKTVPPVLECLLAGDLGDRDVYSVVSKPRPIGTVPVMFTLRSNPGTDFCDVYDDASPVLRINRLQLNSPGFSFAITIWVELGSYTHARDVA